VKGKIAGIVVIIIAVGVIFNWYNQYPKDFEWIFEEPPEPVVYQHNTAEEVCQAYSEIFPSDTFDYIDEKYRYLAKQWIENNRGEFYGFSGIDEQKEKDLMWAFSINPKVGNVFDNTNSNWWHDNCPKGSDANP
jgi:hypothetical protein